MRTKLHDLWHVLHDTALHTDGIILRIRDRKCRHSSTDLHYYMHTRFPFFNQEILTAATFSVKTQQQAAARYAYVRTRSQDSYWVRSALNKTYTHRCRWPRGFPAARWLRLRVRIPLGTLLSVSWMLCFRIEISALGQSLFQGSRTMRVCVECVCGWVVSECVCRCECCVCV